MNWLAGHVLNFALALQFMTRLPVPGAPADLYSPDRFLRSRCHYPLVGVAVGAIASAVYLAAAQWVEPSLAALFAIGAGVAVTGALHEDGLADVFDGLGGGRDRERALVIMKDSRVGVFGVLGLGVVVTAKVLALGELPALVVPFALIAGHALSRGLLLLVIATSAYVREAGTAKAADGRFAAGELVYAGLVMAAAASAPWWLFGWPQSLETVIAVVLGAGVAGSLMWWWVQRKLDGYTGDCLGAIQQCGETGAYLGLAVWF